MSDLRPIVFELLAAFSYLQSKDLIPPEMDLERVVNEAREALLIEKEEQPAEEILEQLQVIKVEDIISVPAVSAANMPAFKICPNCGNLSDKIVHLRKRPPTLQCQACGHEYKWPHRWG